MYNKICFVIEIFCPIHIFKLNIGQVSWDEYHTNFMMEQGFNKTYAVKHPENHKHLKRKGNYLNTF